MKSFATSNVRVRDVKGAVRERGDSAGLSVHTIFEQQVAENPSRFAVVYGETALTYEELNLKSNRLAHHLRSLGVGREALVGVSIERSPDLIVCILGVLKAGGAYLPIDPNDPRERLARMFEDAQPSIVLTKSALSKRFCDNGSKVICVDALDLDGGNSDNPDLGTRNDDLAYVMYTSGSTGNPKGVMIEHRSIIRLVKWTDYADFSAENVFLQFAPITFDASTFEIWGALLNGSRLAIIPEGTASLADIGKAIRDYGVTTLWLTAGLFHLMVDERIDDLRPLRQLLAGGDVLSVTHVQKALRDLDCDLINGYGPTENTTFTCCYKVPRNVELGKSIPIGKPIAKTQVYILGEDLNPVTDGGVGELYIGGDGLARGYLNRVEMTSERFIANPFTDNSSSRLYRSGDLARIRPDGNIEFLGRVDSQVKIRGFRIELEEIEIALTRQAGVRGAVAVARDISAADKQLVTFVVLDPHNPPEVCELRRHLEETLPEYMIPSFIISLEALPITPNGKVDRAALIEKIAPELARTSSYDAPETRTERTIAAILGEILGTGSIGSNDNFFDLGANSLQLARFHNRLQKAFDPSMKIVSLFQNPTIRTLAETFGNGGSVTTKYSDPHERASRQREAYARQKQMRNGGIKP